MREYFVNCILMFALCLLIKPCKIIWDNFENSRAFGLQHFCYPHSLNIFGIFFSFSSVSFMAVNVYATKNKIAYELHLQNESIKLIQLIDLHCHVSNTDNKLLLFLLSFSQKLCNANYDQVKVSIVNLIHEFRQNTNNYVVWRATLRAQIEFNLQQ